MNDKMNKKNVVISLFAGLFVGFLSGFFGGGGGMIVVPLFVFLLGLTQKEAQATAIFTILPLTITSSIIYIIKGKVVFDNLAFTSLGFVVGGILGAYLLKKINNKVLRVIFALLMIVAGIKIIV